MIFVLILACFFISGLTGLVYEVLWTRMIVKIIGTSPFSVTIVLTVFMAGLGFGGWLAARVIDHVKKPGKLIRAYGYLELTVGAYCLLLPLLLKGFEPVYAAIYNQMFQHFLPYNLVTFAGCAILLILPVTCMGATLPVLCRFFVTSLSRVGTHVGRLYALNTIGAAAGSLLCGFWLINALGVWGVLVVAIALNAIIGGLCVFVSFRHADKIVLPRDAAKADNAGAPARMDNAKTAKISAAGQPGKKADKNAQVEARPREDISSFPMALVLIVFAISGFCSMAYEVLWTKLLGLLVGPTTYSFTMVLVAFITGLALGGLVWGWCGDRSRNPVALLAGTQIAAALAALLFSQVMGNSQIFFAKLIYQFEDSFFELHLLKGLFVFAFMFLTTFFLGAAFPLVGRIYTRSVAGAGRSIGYAYAINSIGAVLGSFIAGFIMIPFLGKENSIRLIVCLQLCGALLIWARGMETWKMALWRKLTMLGATASAVALLFFFPSWDHVMLSIGKYHRFDRPEIRRLSWLDSLFDWEKTFPDLHNEKLLFYGDGIGGFTTVLETTGLMGDVNYNLCNSGKPDASSTRDMDTQTLLAHFAMLYLPKPDDALVIGLGSGITAGEILNYPVKRLDVVEINEQVVLASNFFLAENNGVLVDPRANLIIQDGRAHLALTERKYDLVTSEPSNPWMSGIAALYTRDFFDLVAARLKPGGLFVQWIPAYQMDWESFNLIGRTFVAAFPHSLMVTTNPARPSSFLFVGSNEAINLDNAVAARNLEYAQMSSNIKLRNSRLFYNLIVSDNLHALFGDGVINTDNRPLLEYLAPRTMHETDASIIRRIGLGVRTTLSQEVAARQRENQSTVNSQIDYAEYFLSFRGGDDAMLRYPVNLAAATPGEKERYYGIVENFCSYSMVTDYAALTDPELRRRCYSRQEDTLLARLATDKKLSPRRQSAIYAYLGQIALQNQRQEKALEFFTQGLRLTPDDAVAHNNVGIARLALRQFAAAAEAFTAALRLDPASAETCNYLGDALASQGKYGEARIWFVKALEIQPDYARAQLNLQRLTAMGH